MRKPKIPPDKYINKICSTFACSNVIFMIYSLLSFCFYLLNFTLIHVQQQHAPGKSDGPRPVPQILWMLRHLWLNLQVLNDILKVRPENFIKIYQRALGDVLFLSVTAPCCFWASFSIPSTYFLCLTLAKYLSLSKCLQMGLNFFLFFFYVFL